MRKILNKEIDLGKSGEDIAVKYLKRRSYKIIERNFRTKLGEIDIIAENKKELVFVEVKARTSADDEFLFKTVNKEKRRKIANTAKLYVSRKEYRRYKSRFDVVLIDVNKGKKRIELIKNAFRLDGI